MYFCALCSEKFFSRRGLQEHKKDWQHRGRQALNAFAARGWVPVSTRFLLDKGEHLPAEARISTVTAGEIHQTKKGDWIQVKTATSIFQAANIPHMTAEYPDPDANLDKFGRGTFATYVPRAAADAVKEWLALPTKTKRAQHLADYLREMFAEVDWLKLQQDDVARAVTNQEPLPSLPLLASDSEEK